MGGWRTVAQWQIYQPGWRRLLLPMSSNEDVELLVFGADVAYAMHGIYRWCHKAGVAKDPTGMRRRNKGEER